MGIDYWNHAKFLHHKVRNMVRRGWLVKTYNDKMILRGRIKTGEKLENDELDIVHPVGYVAHVKPEEKAEIITLDIGGDTSRRVILAVMGNRKYHPQPDEGEVYTYAPGDKKIYNRMKMKKEGGDSPPSSNGKSGQEGAQTIDRGHEAGIHSDGKDQRITSKTESAYANQADKGIGNKTKGNYTVVAGSNTQMQAGKHIRMGETHRDQQMVVNANIHAADHIAGGGTDISAATATEMAEAANSDETPRPKEDGTKTWQANGRPGTTSLLQTAAAVGTLGALVAAMGQSQQQTNQQQAATNTAQETTNQTRPMRSRH